MMNFVKLSATVGFAVFSWVAWAQTVDVQNAWARPTVQGQKATGVFMTLKAKNGAKLVSVTTPVAGVAEVHVMKMANNIMTMRAVEGGLELPAGKAVQLKPGSYHVMLMELKLPLQKDTTIPLTLVLKDAKGIESKTDIKVPVLNQPPSGAVMPDHGGHGMHHGK